MVFLVTEKSWLETFPNNKSKTKKYYGPTSIKNEILANGKMLLSVMEAFSSLTVLMGNIG